MELKRKYREGVSIPTVFKLAFNNLLRKLKIRNIPKIEVQYKLEQNSWLRRNFSLTGLYYHLSRYGEDLLRPTLIGIAIVLGSTLIWLTQANPTAEPSFFTTATNSHNYSLPELVILARANQTHDMSFSSSAFPGK